MKSFSTLVFDIIPLLLPWRSRLSGAALLGLALYATLGHELLTLQFLGARRWAIYGSSERRSGREASFEELERLERSNRDELLGANREGLVSALGYGLVHLFGVGIGRLVHEAALESFPVASSSSATTSASTETEAEKEQSRLPQSSSSTESPQTRLRLSFLSTLVSLGLAALFTYSSLESFGAEFAASRRVSNSAFVSWIVRFQ